MPLSDSELEPLLGLSLIQGIGPHRLTRLIERFGSAARVLAAKGHELRGVPGFGEDLVQRIASASSTAATDKVRRASRLLTRLGAVALCVEDAAYPSAFFDIPDRPYLLFAVGNTELLRVPAVAVVGTRTPTPYGKRAASTLSSELAASGFAIVSGMARGIDRAAHEGALEAGGATIGVLGHGIDKVYPPESRPLFRQVAERGLIITEYPPGETPRPGNFPRRNRLITALSQAVLVVEMGFKSGAQHTVGYALEQGKEVMAVPGPIASTSSEGTNQLIKDGARMVTSAADVLEELYGIGTYRVSSGFIPVRNESPAGTGSPPALQLLSEQEGRVLEALGVLPTGLDELAAAAGLGASDALVVLLELELRGLIAAEPGMRYSLR